VAKVTMPQLGESVAEGTIGKWLKKPGDHVAKYEPLLEVITDKVNAEVPSPVEGVLKEILVEEGATVPNNAEIAVIEEAGAGAAEAATPAAPTASGGPAEPAPKKEAVEPAEGPAGSDERPERAPRTAESGAAPSPVGADSARPAATATASQPAIEAPAGAPSAAAATAAPPSTSRPADANGSGAIAVGPGDADARMTPAVRRLLREHGLHPQQIVGSGGGGRITREDVINFVEAQRTGQPVKGQSPGAAASPVPTAATPPTQPGPAAQPGTAGLPIAGPAPSGDGKARGIPGQKISFPDGADEVLVPMTQMRKGIAAQMTRALAVPHAYVQMEVDATALVRLRESAKRDFQAREGTSLSYVPFVVKAVVEALAGNPAFNAHWTENGLLAKRRINVGVAVAVDDGLIVPVVRDVDQLSIAGINRAIADVAARARANRLRVDDFGGGTFTIDNTGWFGSNMTMPIINVPEVAILTMEAITKRAVVVESPTGDSIGVRPVMNMVLAIDHRANDGAQAAAFLGAVKRWLEAIGPNVPIF
jgi:pyruvate/2-oxoglutarate dehydrogenase complex dihydrolipoamide acyltransferase (E2) component